MIKHIADSQLSWVAILQKEARLSFSFLDESGMQQLVDLGLFAAFRRRGRQVLSTLRAARARGASVSSKPTNTEGKDGGTPASSSFKAIAARAVAALHPEPRNTSNTRLTLPARTTHQRRRPMGASAVYADFLQESTSPPNGSFMPFVELFVIPFVQASMSCLTSSTSTGTAARGCSHRVQQISKVRP